MATEIETHKPSGIGGGAGKDNNTLQVELQGDLVHKTGTAQKHRHLRLPQNYDSLICYIPMNVTADLGIAMKRVRKRRCEKFRKLFPPPKKVEKEAKDDGDGDDDENDEASIDGSQKSGDGSDNDGEGDSQERSPNRKKKKKNNDNENDDDEDNDNAMDKIGTEIRREQFSSMVDYLEAKYSKGVMIDDLDERVREKNKNKKSQSKSDGKKQKGGGANAGDDLSVLSDSEAGSCYSDDSGNFIDDSELRTDVAHQILASSAFGTTKIEAEAVHRAKGDHDGDGHGDGDESIMNEDDHAFFVNVGDLEMEDGWEDQIEEDNDWLNSMKKSKGYVSRLRDLEFGIWHIMSTLIHIDTLWYISS